MPTHEDFPWQRDEAATARRELASRQSSNRQPPSRSNGNLPRILIWGLVGVAGAITLASVRRHEVLQGEAPPSIGNVHRIAAFLALRPSFPTFVACFIAVGVPLVLIHELGHAWAASRLSRGPIRIRVGSYIKVVSIHVDRLELDINLVPALTEPAGITRWRLDRHLDPGSIIKASGIVAAAGPVASVGALLATVVLYNSSRATGLWHDLLWTAIAYSCLLLFGTLVPSGARTTRRGPQPSSDGQKILEALKARSGAPR